MNNSRRKLIDALLADLAKWHATSETLQERIDYIISDEQDAFDALPESFQDGVRGEAMHFAIEHLQEAYDALTNAAESLQEATDALGSAKGDE